MTPRKQRALAVLIRSPTVEAAAQELGMGYSTLRRWIKTDEEFRGEYEAALADIFMDASKQARHSLAPALTALREIVENEETPAAARVQGARVILESSLKLAEMTDVIERLNRLEQSIQEDE